MKASSQIPNTWTKGLWRNRFPHKKRLEIHRPPVPAGPEIVLDTASHLMWIANEERNQIP